MRRTVLLLLSLLIVSPVMSQDRRTPVEEEVRAVIDQLFDGMVLGDSAMVRDAFAPDVRLVTTFSRDGVAARQEGNIEQFIAAIGTPRDQQWNERVWNVQIEVRDNLASAWMDFGFYVDDQLSHCGVNTMQFVRNGEGDWKMVFIADTRTPGPRCDVPLEAIQEADVRAALRNYLRGHATGDGSYHEKVFHPESKLFWMRDGQLNQRTSEEYIAGASGQPSEDESERRRYIDWVSVDGDAAVGRIVLDYPSAYIVDYMTLLKIDGRWQIVNKAFTVQPN